MDKLRKGYRLHKSLKDLGFVLLDGWISRPNVWNLPLKDVPNKHRGGNGFATIVLYVDTKGYYLAYIVEAFITGYNTEVSHNMSVDDVIAYVSSYKLTGELP